MQLDHVAVAAQTLAGAVAHVEQALGVTMLPGGRHARFATHNQLLGLADGLYLEAIAVDPEAALPAGSQGEVQGEVQGGAQARWFDLDRFRGPARLSNWICRVDDLDAALAALPGAGRAVDLVRGNLRWRMAVPVDGILPFGGLFPALIQWRVADLPGDTLAQSGAGLRRLELNHPDAARLAGMLAPFVDDDRIEFRAGQMGMRAIFDTPGGERELV